MGSPGGSPVWGRATSNVLPSFSSQYISRWNIVSMALIKPSQQPICWHAISGCQLGDSIQTFSVWLKSKHQLPWMLMDSATCWHGTVCDCTEPIFRRMESAPIVLISPQGRLNVPWNAALWTHTGSPVLICRSRFLVLKDNNSSRVGRKAGWYTGLTIKRAKTEQQNTGYWAWSSLHFSAAAWNQKTCAVPHALWNTNAASPWTFGHHCQDTSLASSKPSSRVDLCVPISTHASRIIFALQTSLKFCQYLF